MLTRIVLTTTLLFSVGPSRAQKTKTAWIWPDPLLGTWANDPDYDPVRVIIKRAGQGVTVDLGWRGNPAVTWSGPQTATLFSEDAWSPKAVAFRARYQGISGPVMVTGRIRGGALEVEVFSEDTDGLGLYNNLVTAKMKKSD